MPRDTAGYAVPDQSTREGRVGDRLVGAAEPQKLQQLVEHDSSWAHPHSVHSRVPGFSATFSAARQREAERPAVLPRRPARAAHPGPRVPSPALSPKVGGPRVPRGPPTRAPAEGARWRLGRSRRRRPAAHGRATSPSPTPGTPPPPRRRPTGEEAAFRCCAIPWLRPGSNATCPPATCIKRSKSQPGQWSSPAGAGRAARVREGGVGRGGLWQIACRERVKLLRLNS